MKRNCLLLILALAIVLTISGCIQNDVPAFSANQSKVDITDLPPDEMTNDTIDDFPIVVSPTIGFIIYTGTEAIDKMTLEEISELETIATPAYWNMSTGSVEIGQDPIILTREEDYWEMIASWDGSEKVLIRNEFFSIDKFSNFDYTELYFQEDNLVIDGHKYILEMKPNGECLLTDMDTEKTVERNLAKGLDSQNISFSDLSYLKSSFFKQNIHIAFQYYDDTDGLDVRIIYATINVDNDTIEWSPAITIPKQYSSSLLTAGSGDVQFVGNRLYFSGWNTIAFLDIEKNQVFGMEQITDKFDTFFPNTQRINDGTSEKIIEDTCPIGSSDEVVLCSIEYYGIDSSDTHYLYYAIKGDRLIGAMSLNLLEDGNTITTYDSTLNLLQTVDIHHLMLKKIPVKFQTNSYP